MSISRERTSENPLAPAMPFSPTRKARLVLRTVIPSNQVLLAANRLNSVWFPSPSNTTSPSPAALMTMGRSGVPLWVR